MIKTTRGTFPKAIFSQKRCSGSSRSAFSTKNEPRDFPESHFLVKTRFGIFPKGILSQKHGSKFWRKAFSVKNEVCNYEGRPNQKTRFSAVMFFKYCFFVCSKKASQSLEKFVFHSLFSHWRVLNQKFAASMACSLKFEKSKSVEKILSFEYFFEKTYIACQPLV